MKTGHNLLTTMLIMVPPEDENRTQSFDHYAHHMIPPEDENRTQSLDHYAHHGTPGG